MGRGPVAIAGTWRIGLGRTEIRRRRPRAPRHRAKE